VFEREQEKKETKIKMGGRNNKISWIQQTFPQSGIRPAGMVEVEGGLFYISIPPPLNSISPIAVYF